MDVTLIIGAERDRVMKKQTKNNQTKIGTTAANGIDSNDVIEKTPAAETAIDEKHSSFPVVGIGASAGGLAAFEAFFSGMPADTDPGMAFVLVQHLAPDHKSILTDLIRRYTRMQVFEVEDGMVVQPNCAYIIPPNCEIGRAHV
jgi:two-component system CheB/CheR fusion protein